MPFTRTALPPFGNARPVGLLRVSTGEVADTRDMDIFTFASNIQDAVSRGTASGFVVVRGGSQITRRMLCDALARACVDGVSLIEPGVLADAGGDADAYVRNVIQELRIRVYSRPRFMPVDEELTGIDAHLQTYVANCMMAGVVCPDRSASGGSFDPSESIYAKFEYSGTGETIAWLHGRGPR